MHAWKYGLAALVLFFAVTFAISLNRAYSKAAVIVPEPAVGIAGEKEPQRAIFAGGCFWCTEAVFEQLKGVDRVISGYVGGSRETARYNLVSSGATRHAEVVEVHYDPSRISYGQLLEVFFSVAHDPTQLNRQGPDWGPQYRSAIFPVTPEQKRVAEAYIRQLEEAKVFPQPVVTAIEPLEAFYPAEDNHQDYVKRHPIDPYVVVNAKPKLRKLRNTFPALAKALR
jgi:peptide-methionine (S)-S-oxide reductase